MKIVLWGAGDRACRAIPYIGKENIIAVIDVDENKIGGKICDVDIISFDEYREKFLWCFILITPLTEKTIVEQLESYNIYNYFCLSDCPAEMAAPVYTDKLREYANDLFSDGEKKKILGISFFSLLLNQWHLEKLDYALDIIIPRDIPDRFVELLKKNYTIYNFYKEDEVDYDSCQELLVTDEWITENIDDESQKHIKLINVYDIAQNTNLYYNPIIEKYKNKHENKSCFIVGLGPSLRYKDLNFIKKKKIISFSVNSVYNIFSETEWRPTYYVGEDKDLFFDKGFNNPEEYCRDAAFIGDTNSDFWLSNHSPKVIKTHPVFNSSTKQDVKFSEDVSRIIYTGGTVVYSCIQIAAYMGIKTIYLLGIDFVEMVDGIDKIYNVSHFYDKDRYVPENRFWPYQQLRLYESAKKYANKHGIRIYNVTRGGYLEVFPRLNIDEILR